MRLSRLEISNHARIADLDIQIREHLVIVGANDVGKSSILRLLHLVLGSSTGQLYQNLSPSDLQDPDLPLVVTVTLCDFTDPERGLFHREIAVDASDNSETLRIRLDVSPDPDDIESIVATRSFPDRGDDSARLSREQLVAIGWRFLPATRGSGPSQMVGPNSALRILLDGLDLGVEKLSLGSLMDDFNIELGESEVLSDLRKQIAGHMSKAMPHTVQTDDLVVRSTADPETSVLENVSMFIKSGGKTVPITEQSDGLRQLMSMTLFDLSEGGSNIVAVDEPELHLHPASQRTIAGLFTSGNNQKILVTHSPYIVQQFEPSHVVAVGRDSKSHQVAEHKLSAVEKVRSHWWSPRLLEALTARFVIVVEGIADRIIVEGAAKALGISLDRLGAVVFELDGADKFAHVYKILGKDGFGAHILGLVDDKEKNPWIGAFGGRPKNVLGRHVWVSTEDLEDEYAAAFGGPGLAKVLIDASIAQEQALLMSGNVESLDDLTVETLAAYSRKDKVLTATAVANALTSATARNITSVASLLDELKRLTSE